MKRREFIKAGAATATVAGAAGVGGAVGSACGGLFEGDTLDVGRIPLPDMESYLKKLDEGLRRIDEWNITDEIGETADDLSRENDLTKKALRSLYTVGMFGDLPDEGQVHPGMQARVKRALPEMDEAVSKMIEYLQGVSDEDARAAQNFLKAKSDPGMEFAEWMDGKAWSVDVSTSRRLKTRAMLTQAVSRLKNQPPRTVFGEYISKVEKAAAQAGSVEEMERLMIARVGERAFWERQQRLAAYVAAWEDEGASFAGVNEDELPPLYLPESDAGLSAEPEDAGVPTEATQPAAEPDRDAGTPKIVMTQEQLDALIEERVKRATRIAERDNSGGLARDGLTAGQRKTKLLRAAGLSLGFGLIIVGASLPIALLVDFGMVSGWFATAGGVLFLIGLIMLIVVGIKYSEVERE